MWPTDQVTKWPSDQVTEWPSDQVTKWLSDRVTEWQEASQTIGRMVYFYEQMIRPQSRAMSYKNEID